MDADLSLVDVHYSLVEARVARSMLDAHGIYAHAPSEFVAVSPHLMIAHGGLPLWVPASQAEDARLLLKAADDTDIGPPPPRRRVLEALSGAIVFMWSGIPPGPSQAGGHSQLPLLGPLACTLLAMVALTSEDLRILIFAALIWLGMI